MKGLASEMPDFGGSTDCLTEVELVVFVTAWVELLVVAELGTPGGVVVDPVALAGVAVDVAPGGSGSNWEVLFLVS